MVAALAVAWFLAGTGQARASYVNTFAIYYHGQTESLWCGEATAQMILGSPVLGGGPPPAGQDDHAIQQDIYNRIQSPFGNQVKGDPGTRPWGLSYAINSYTVPNYYYFTHQDWADYNAATLHLAYSIDSYTVGSQVGAPGGAMIWNGSHWVVINGIDTNVKPNIDSSNTLNFTVNGFYITDPWDGFQPGTGLGKNAYLTTVAGGGWAQCFTPAKWYPGTHYFFVTDPSVTAAAAGNSAPLSGGDPINDAATARAVAASGVASSSGLAGDLSFMNGAFTSTGEREFAVPDGFQVWEVPYYQSAGAGYASNPSGVVLLNASTGDMVGAWWDEGQLTADSLAGFDSYLANQFYGGGIHDNDVSAVPEPASLTLFGLGALGLLGLAWRRRR
jgi:hypothetical protein